MQNNSIVEEIDKLRKENKNLRNQLNSLPILNLSFLDLVDNIIIALDAQAEVKFINKAGVELLGYPKNEILGENWFEKFLPPAMKKAVIEVFNKIMNKEMEFVEYFENSVLDRNGNEHLIGWHNSFNVDQNGKIIRIISAGVDITKRTKAEKELKKEGDFLTTVLNAQRDTFFLFDPITRRAIRWNKAFQEISGYSDKEIAILKAPDSYYDEETLQKIAKYLDIIINTGSGQIEADLIVKDGNIIPFEYQVSTIKDENGNVKYFVSIGRDIAEWKIAQQQLASEKENLAVTLRNIGEGVITINRYGKILIFNEMAEEITNHSYEEAIGKNILDILPLNLATQKGTAMNLLTKALSLHSREKYQGTSILKMSGGSQKIIDYSIAPINNGEQGNIGYVIAFRDISIQRRLEEELNRNQSIESIGLLAGGIAHDFNNILTAILGNITLAKMEAEENTDLLESLQDAEKGANQAQRLTNQLLTFSKGGAPIKEVASTENLIKEAARFSLHGSSIGVEFDIENEIWNINVDKGQFGQVMQNIVLNAVQAMDGKGIIKISATNYEIIQDQKFLHEGKYVNIRIQDTGIGISAENLPKIFDLYFSTKKGQNFHAGNGLGLPVSRSIIKKHGGTIDVESEEGMGTTFSFFFPAIEPNGKSIKKQKQDLTVKNQNSNQRKILVLEDEPLVTKVLATMLRKLNYVSDFTTEGDITIKKYFQKLKENDPYDVLILDLTIPGALGGLDTFNALKKIDPNLKAIVSSGYATGNIMSHYEEFGFKGMLVKPYTIGELKEVLLNVL
ncbi:Sensor histidine kinase RcsC [Candidatus Lokiarchaeum ossiferum]|uniref:Sensor histidine kinase RcsC n=1 Tax=Candidatus Lokiarchaeum ossiferum TaxID=2951803 RepID=A0ABY6HQD5_9ARCH|nr:Sensor histidine kinase RcsC [Candidatus Lokiarchaeum sp. B-35]